MSHILIQNPGELPIWGMRLLGLSNKRADQIGQFGTGLKESIALMARMGQLPVIYSGKCRIDFKVETLDEQQEVCFMLSETNGRFNAGEWHGLGIHPNFGAADWDNPWMIFRETICNALDEGGVEGLYHEAVSTEPEGVEGATRVYLPCSPEMMAAYGTVSDRLLMLSPQAVAAAHMDTCNHTLVKGRQKSAQIFHRGVWVQEDHRESLFDYDLADIRLNESRSADWHDINGLISKMMVGWPVEQAQSLIMAIVKDKKTSDNLYEVSPVHYAHFFANVIDAKTWKEAFHNLFGPTAVMTDNDAHFCDRLEELGFKPVIIMDVGLRQLLKAAGVREPGDVLTEAQSSYEVVESPSAAQQSVFDDVWDRLNSVGLTNGKAKPGLMVFKPLAGGDATSFGSYKDGVCYVNMTFSGSPQERVTCIEEIAHHVSGSADFTRAYQEYLMQAIDTFMFANVEV